MALRRYAAFLRGVMPTNARQADLARAFEAAGFAEVRTVLGSGNVVFSAPAAAARSLERLAEAALRQGTGRAHPALVRSVEALEALLEADPFAAWAPPAGARRVVTFLRAPPLPPPRLPVEEDGARIEGLSGAEAFTTYLRIPRGPVFMKLIARTFGDDQTSRTWETVGKVVRAAARR